MGRFLLLFFVVLVLCSTGALAEKYVEAEPLAGDGILSMLRRYELPDNSVYLEKFIELNADHLNQHHELHLGHSYLMPIMRFRYNRKSIRSTLGISDYQHAKRIQDFNEALLSAGLKEKHYRDDLDLWVPLFELTEPASLPAGQIFPIFGSSYQSVDIINSRLDGCVFYLVSGHGGPDPGAIGKRGPFRLYEDEYAYDITLRLARRLVEHGALVYMIVRDKDDGIRDDVILRGDKDEFYFGGAAIPSGTVARLRKRADIINGLYHKNSVRQQYALILHVDSRTNSKRIDIFYYYQRANRTSKSLALTLYRQIKEKYALAQPGRGYRGHVGTRDLYMLRHTEPTTVYIELGNIKNSLDQDRFVIANNRQAVANWLCEGLLKHCQSN